MEFTYPKHEKLKSRKSIERIFSEGKSVSKFPLRLAYVSEPEERQMVRIGVSVSKKYFKKAVDRNYFKRLLRESYRLNKHLLCERLEGPHAFMLLYQTRERLTFEEVKAKTALLFEKFHVAAGERDK
ncbi:MAG TPA: ribonuclease P protein component [Flavobacterium sp.]|jgi:ribonuclease P protein component